MTKVTTLVRKHGRYARGPRVTLPDKIGAMQLSLRPLEELVTKGGCVKVQ